MRRANISTTKNNLSKLIDEVRRGATITIVDRDVPVAQLRPIRDLDQLAGSMAALARDGIVSIPDERLNAETFLARKRPGLSAAASAVAALLAERADAP